MLVLRRGFVEIHHHRILLVWVEVFGLVEQSFQLTTIVCLPIYRLASTPIIILLLRIGIRQLLRSLEHIRSHPQILAFHKVGFGKGNDIGILRLVKVSQLEVGFHNQLLHGLPLALTGFTHVVTITLCLVVESGKVNVICRFDWCLLHPGSPLRQLHGIPTHHLESISLFASQALGKHFRLTLA